MRKTIVYIFIICLVFTMAGCIGRKAENTTPVETTNPTTAPSTTDEISSPISQAAMAAVSVPAVTEEIVADDGTVLFQYTYQNMSLVLQEPEVADKVIIDFLARIDQTRTDAESVANAAKMNYSGQSEWIPYLYHITYSPMRMDYGVLSLFGANAIYRGSFHPERTCLSASYDLITGDVLTLASIMDASATTSDFCDLVLDGLSEIAAENFLYPGYEDVVKQRFSVDESQDQDWYFSQTGLCFYFEPYEIAPYSSGVITVEIPYEKLYHLLHANYFPTDREGAYGMVLTSRFEDADFSQFSQIAEVIQNKDGQMYLLYTDKSVQDVRIFVTDAASTYTIFAAYGLTPGDAIMVQADDTIAQTLKISYKANNNTISIPLT